MLFSNENLHVLLFHWSTPIIELLIFLRETYKKLKLLFIRKLLHEHIDFPALAPQIFRQMLMLERCDWFLLPGKTITSPVKFAVMHA